MLESYRVRKMFQWDGWWYAPDPGKACTCQCASDGVDCQGGIASGCACNERSCRCSCRIKPDLYAGDIWVVESGNPRKETMLGNRFAIGDASIPAMESLMAEHQYKKLLTEPGRAHSVLVQQPPLRPPTEVPALPREPEDENGDSADEVRQRREARNARDRARREKVKTAA